MSEASGQRLVFVHVPKTAGTSFRVALAANFRRNQIFFHYAASSPVTSPVLRRPIREKRFGVIRRLLDQQDRFLLAGHFNAGLYQPLLPPRHFVTFLREPFARLVSEYKHFVRHHGETRSFQEFLEAPDSRNRQTRLVGDAGEYAFIGLVETFEADVGEMEARFGLRIDTSRRFLTGAYETDELHCLRQRHSARFRELNQPDIELYEKIVLARGGRA
jgi:hypothetical protein